MKNAIIFGLGLMVVSSCNKTTNYSHIDKLVDKEWKLVAKTQNGAEISEACELDNTLVFRANSNLEQNFGVSNCEDLEFESKKWKFGENYSLIKFKYEVKNRGSFATGYVNWEVVELTDSTLVLKQETAQSQEVKPIIKYYSL